MDRGLDHECATGHIWQRLDSQSQPFGRQRCQARGEGRPLLLALLPSHATELLPDTVDVPAVLPATTWATGRCQVGDDLARGDVALD
jgi:hypothetical protein